MSVCNTISVGDRLPESIKTTGPVFINFFATWCSPCVHELPDLQSLYHLYKDRIQFLFIHCGGTYDELRLFLEKNNFDFVVTVDTDNSISEIFNVRSIPLTVLADKDKIIRNIIVGARSATEYEKEIKKICGLL